MRGDFWAGLIGGALGALVAVYVLMYVMTLPRFWSTSVRVRVHKAAWFSQ